MDLLGLENYDDLKDAHAKWVDSTIQTNHSDKEKKWTQSLAVGSKTFIEEMKDALGFRATCRLLGSFTYLIFNYFTDKSGSVFRSEGAPIGIRNGTIRSS